MSVIQLQHVQATTSANNCSTSANISRIALLSGEVQVELTWEDGHTSVTQLNQSQFNDLKLQPQQQVFIDRTELILLLRINIISRDRHQLIIYH